MAIESFVLDKRFQLGKVLGRGPSGVVCLAKDLSQGSDCAVKRIYAKYGNRNILDKVQAVAHSAADMMHPAILGVLYTGYEPSGTLYLVSPLVSGETLRTRLSRGPLSVSAMLALLDPLCAALQAASERDLAHGALSPNNIFLLADDTVLISDFGMAQLRATPGARWDGPLGYVAPETLDTGAERATARADVFSVGTLVYECLLGQPMFDAKSLASYLAMVGTPPKMKVRYPTYAHLDAVLEMAAAADPDARFATIQALWRALQSALLDLPANLANNLTRGMTPQVQRQPSASRPPSPPTQAGQTNAGSPPPEPRPASAGPNALEPGVPPPNTRNVQEMPLLPVDELDLEEAEPSGGFRAPGAPKTAPLQKLPGPVTQKLPEPLPPPPGSASNAPVPTSATPSPGATTAPFPSIPGKPVPQSPSASKTPEKADARPVVALPAVPVPPGSAARPGRSNSSPDLKAPGAPRRSDPQQILPTDPSYRLRVPPGPKTSPLAPLFWATLGGIVVGGSMLGVQFYARLNQNRPVSAYASGIDVDTLLRQAQTEAFQHNFHSAMAFSELILRKDSQHPGAKAILETASEQLRTSAVYGAFLRAADRDQDDLAVALYRELPPGSPYRAQAWDPFMKVRNQFVRRRLAFATAALAAGDCQSIYKQIEKLYFIADSATDSALQQGQRLLGKCKADHGLSQASTESNRAKQTDDKTEHATKTHKPEPPDKSDKAEKPDKPDKPDKPEVLANSDAAETPKSRRRRSKDKTASEPAATAPPTAQQPKEKEALPSALRNPF